MGNLKNMWRNWKGLSVVFTAVLTGITVLFMQSCRATREVSNTQAVRTEIIREVVRDTVITVKPDQATIKALLECDSTGNVLIRQLAEYEAGERLKPPRINVQDNVLTASAETDSLSVYLALKDRYTERADTVYIDKSKIIEVNRLNGWQKLRMWIGNVMLILIPVGTLIYLRTKKII